MDHRVGVTANGSTDRGRNRHEKLATNGDRANPIAHCRRRPSHHDLPTGPRPRMRLEFERAEQRIEPAFAHGHVAIDEHHHVARRELGRSAVGIEDVPALVEFHHAHVASERSQKRREFLIGLAHEHDHLVRNVARGVRYERFEEPSRRGARPWKQQDGGARERRIRCRRAPWREVRRGEDGGRIWSRGGRFGISRMPRV